MPSRRRNALGAVAAALALALPVLTGACMPARSTAATLDYIGSYVWSLPEEDFGGFSGLELSDDGSRFHALSDRATLRWGQVERDAAGVIRGLHLSGRTRLRDSKGKPLVPGYLGDSEGLALAPDGRIWVSFEGLDRIAGYTAPDVAATRIPSPESFKQLQANSALEALAITPEGDLLMLPERSGKLTRPFPVWRYDPARATWEQPFTIPRSGNWLPVGADIGPDGKLYLLERDFQGLLGFRTRIRRFDLTREGVSGEETLLESGTLQYDNLEGIAVWHDGLGIRLTMISDDNFNFVQRTELVEYRLRE